jgi:hypothetical protein
MSLLARVLLEFGHAWAANVDSSGVLCCHWTDRFLECAGNPADQWLCPASCACDGPSWVPPEWLSRISQGSLLVGSPDQPGGTIGNGYVGAWIPRGLPGSAGSPVAGVEHVKNVFRVTRPLSGPGVQPGDNQVTLASLPSWVATAFVDSLNNMSFPATASAIDVGLAAHLVATSSQNGTSGYCVQTTFAHRSRPAVVVAQFECTNPAGSPGVLTAVIKLKHCNESWLYHGLCGGGDGDGNGSPSASPPGVRQLRVGGAVCSQSAFSSAETPQSTVPVVAECHTDVPPEGVTVSVNPGESQTLVLVSARVSNMDYDSAAGANNTNNAAAATLHNQSNARGRGGPVGLDDSPWVDLALAVWGNATEDSSQLWPEHSAAMAALNAVGIEVEGNASLAQLVNASLFSLLSSYRSASEPGSSSSSDDVGEGGAQRRLGGGAPEGLASTRYFGELFWDVETWQWPSLLVFWPDHARGALDFRASLQEQARANARLPLPFDPPGAPPHEGLRFPWQSATAGIEQDPGNDEDHLQGDVALAFLQYYYATLDDAWLNATGFPVVSGIAQFYASRVRAEAVVVMEEKEEEGEGKADAAVVYHIDGTMGPDEYNANVTDSAYGNAVARAALRAAYALAPAAGAQPNTTFQRIADGLVIPYDPVLDYHPEFQGYTPNTSIKQADTVLLYYPLGLAPPADVNASTRANDLAHYASVVDPLGPAMTWSIHAIVHRDVGDEAAAAASFAKAFAGYAHPPFYVWHEGAADKEGADVQGAPNLVTGAGGFLQTVWAGYGGVRFEAPGVLGLRRPAPLPGSDALRLRGVHFLGARLDVAARAAAWSVALSAQSPPSAPPLKVVLEDGAEQPLLPGHELSFPSGTSVRVVKA